MCMLQVAGHRQNGGNSVIDNMFGKEYGDRLAGGSSGGPARPAAPKTALGRNQDAGGDNRAGANAGTVLTSGGGVSVFAPRENKTLLGQ